MKKMIFGGLLLLCGVIGIMTLLAISIVFGASFLPFIGKTNTGFVFLISCISSMVGLYICYHEAYQNK